jgi:hypothetical protein
VDSDINQCQEQCNGSCGALSAYLQPAALPIENVPLFWSSGLEEVKSLICVSSARKLLVDMLSKISPLTSALSISDKEKWSWTRDMSSLAFNNGIIKASDGIEDLWKVSVNCAIERVYGIVVRFLQACANLPWSAFYHSCLSAMMTHATLRK